MLAKKDYYRYILIVIGFIFGFFNWKIILGVLFVTNDLFSALLSFGLISIFPLLVPAIRHPKIAGILIIFCSAIFPLLTFKLEGNDELDIISRFFIWWSLPVFLIGIGILFTQNTSKIQQEPR